MKLKAFFLTCFELVKRYCVYLFFALMIIIGMIVGQVLSFTEDVLINLISGALLGGLIFLLFGLILLLIDLLRNFIDTCKSIYQCKLNELKFKKTK